MPDVFSKAKRSHVMSLIKSKGNKDTELKFVAFLPSHDITGWRRQQSLPGKPDFIFRRERLAIFVDGCFWHGCRTHCRMPKSRRDFWPPKIAKNRARDRRVNLILKSQGWRVIRVWEHSLSNPRRILNQIKTILASHIQTKKTEKAWIQSNCLLAGVD